MVGVAAEGAHEQFFKLQNPEDEDCDLHIDEFERLP